jgi:hypothetical protein
LIVMGCPVLHNNDIGKYDDCARSRGVARKCQFG